MVRRCRPSSLLIGCSLAAALAAAPPVSGRAADPHGGLRLLVGGGPLAGAVHAALSAGSSPSSPSSAVDVAPEPLRSLQDAVASGSPLPDLLLVSATDVALGCAQHLFRPLPPATDCARPVFAAGFVLADDPVRTGFAPRWADFWDVARWPGRRGLPRDGRGALEIALMADGVAAANVYATLGTDAGVARAFRKLEQLRPYVDWWTDGVAARRALQKGAVLMTALPLSVLPAAPSDGTLALDRGGTIGDALCWAVPIGAPHEEAAAAFATSTPDPAFVDAIAARIAVRPLAAALPGGARRSPNDTDARPAAETSRPVLTIDPVFWRDHQALDARFRAWLVS